MFPEINFGTLDVERGCITVMHVLESGVVWIVDDNGKIAATCGLVPSVCWWWTSDVYVIDKWVFVRKQYRKSRAFLLLMKAVQMTAAKSPYPVLLSISSPYDTTAKERLFARYGKKLGNFFMISPMES